MKPVRLIPVLLLALAACHKAPEASPDAKPGLSVSAGTLVLPAVSGNPGAAYFALNNGSGKVVTLAAVSVDEAGKAEMHETSGVAMTPLVALEVKAGETVSFDHGGKHVMLFDLSPKLAAGGTAEMTLTFADGDKLSAPLKIEAAGAMDMGEHKDHHGRMD